MLGQEGLIAKIKLDLRLQLSLITREKAGWGPNRDAEEPCHRKHEPAKRASSKWEEKKSLPQGIGWESFFFLRRNPEMSYSVVKCHNCLKKGSYTYTKASHAFELCQQIDFLILEPTYRRSWRRGQTSEKPWRQLRGSGAVSSFGPVKTILIFSAYKNTS